MSEKVDPWCCREVAFSFQRVRHTDNLPLGASYVRSLRTVPSGHSLSPCASHPSAKCIRVTAISVHSLGLSQRLYQCRAHIDSVDIHEAIRSFSTHTNCFTDFHLVEQLCMSSDK